jgi:hypothetical protein
MWSFQNPEMNFSYKKIGSESCHQEPEDFKSNVGTREHTIINCYKICEIVCLEIYVNLILVQIFTKYIIFMTVCQCTIVY